MAKVVRENTLFHSSNVEYNHFFAICGPVDNLWEFLIYNKFTWIMSQSLQMNSVSVCFLESCSDMELKRSLLWEKY